MTQLIVAYDKPTLDANDRFFLEALPTTLPGVLVKVGLEAHYTLHDDGMSVAERVLRICRDKGTGVFVDAKLSDIANTVEKAARAIAATPGVEMLTVMANISTKALAAAAIECVEQGVVCLGVTVPTDMDAEDCFEVYGTRNIPGKVLQLAKRARDCGLGGIVCSGHELPMLREAGLLDGECGLKTVIPGIRPMGAARNDQNRTMTPAEAVRLGAGWIVVGRPIMEKSNRLGAAAGILNEMARAA